MEQRQIATSTLKQRRMIKKRKLQDLALVLFWGIVLAIDTWVESLEQLLSFKSVGFHWISHPDFWSFFNFNDLTLIHQYFVIIKLGHFTGFAIMDLLLFRLLRKHSWSIAISFLFALSTEILQLFFGRDGRLYDLIIDSLGILTVYLFLKSRK